MQPIIIRQATPDDADAIHDLLAAEGRRQEAGNLIRNIRQYTVVLHGCQLAAVSAEGQAVTVHPGYPEKLTSVALGSLLQAVAMRENAAQAWHPTCKESVNSCGLTAAESCRQCGPAC